MKTVALVLGKIKKLFGFSSPRIVFVIGTGRSGTHWLGYTLGGHPDILVAIEEEPIFSLSTNMALNPALEGKLFKRMVLAYQWNIIKSSHLVYLDKTHPNLWLAEKLKDTFPQSRFIAIERNPYATVASMIKHEGVLAWHHRWREFPIPNRFLGITEELAQIYDDLPLASQCALRWVAHHDRINKLRDTLGEDLLVISYESLAGSTDHNLQRLQSFLGLPCPIPMPDIKYESIHKWVHELSDAQITHIKNIVGFGPDEISFT